MKPTVAAWLIFSAAVLAFGVWRYRQPPAPRAQVALLYDRSESMSPGCGSVVALGQRALTLPHVREDSTLTFFTTGDRGSGFEPVLVATYSLPVTRLATESNKWLIGRQQAFLLDLQRRCAALPSTKTSPIALAIKQALAHLGSLGDDHTVRYLLARTDLQETVDTGVKRALAQRASGPAPDASIDNAGVEIVLCGSAELAGPGNRFATERIKEVWTALFTRPDEVRFEPYCFQQPVRLGGSE